MREVTLQDLAEARTKKCEHTMCVVAPNYEPRSSWATSELVRKLKSKNVKFLILTLQSDRYQTPALEYLKKQEIETTIKLVGRRSPVQRTVSYPEEFLPNTLKHWMLHSLKQIQRPYVIVLDISALARRVILAMMHFLSSQAASLDSVYVLYSWAEEYPQRMYPAEAGELEMVKRKIALAKGLDGVKHISAVLFPGRQTFDGRQFIDTLRKSNHQIQVYVFMNRDNPFRSLEVMRANVPGITGTDSSLSLGYYSTLISAHTKILKWAEGCPIDKDNAYLIAPFGPKPLTISAYLGLSAINRKCSGALSDVVLLSSHQYCSVYSLGHRALSAFRLEPSELLVGSLP